MPTRYTYVVMLSVPGRKHRSGHCLVMCVQWLTRMPFSTTSLARPRALLCRQISGDQRWIYTTP